MDFSFLTNLRQSLPDYLVSSLTLAGVTSLDLFLSLSDGQGASCNAIPIPEVVSYLREQLPLLNSLDQLQAYLPPGLNASSQDLETARRQVQHWNIPPGTKYLLFRVQADLRAQVEALELSSAEARHLVNLPFSVSPKRHRNVSRCRELSPTAQRSSQEPLRDDSLPVKPSPAKLPRLAPDASGDVTMASPLEGNEEGGKRRRTRKRARRSKNPAPAPVPDASPAPAPVPVSKTGPSPSSRLGHVIFNSDGEVAEERQPAVNPHAVEAAQNRRQCKSKPNYEFPQMSRKAQLNSRQSNRSFYLKNDGSAPEIPAHALRKQPAPAVKAKASSSSSSPEAASVIPPKKKALTARGPKVVNVDLDNDSSTSSSSESEPETSLQKKITEAPQKFKDSKNTSLSFKDLKDTPPSHQSSKDTPSSYQKDIPIISSDPHVELNDTPRSCKDPEDFSSISHDPRKDISASPSRDTHSLNGSQVEVTDAGDSAVPEKLPYSEPRDYNSLETLKNPPEAGSLIAFKILELDPNSFTPEVSDFKEGRFLSFDQVKRRCQVEVLVNKRISVGEGKFDVWMESSDGQVLTNFEKEERTLMTSWEALQEVKLISGPQNDSC